MERPYEVQVAMENYILKRTYRISSLPVPEYALEIELEFLEQQTRLVRRTPRRTVKKLISGFIKMFINPPLWLTKEVNE